MRSYGQWCALAKALDVVGDRWTLLIMRELLIRGACRYTDIRTGLPGIATNLLAGRLRELEEAGIVTHEEAPPPVATALYCLTARGLALEPALLALGNWGGLLLQERGKHDIFFAHWLVPPLKLHLRDTRPRDPAISIELRAGGESIAVTAERGSVDVRLGKAQQPAAIVEGKPEALFALCTGRIGPEKAKSAGLRIEGDALALKRFLPRRPQG